MVTSVMDQLALEAADRYARETIETFTRTADDDWRTVITLPGGRTENYVYVPGAKVTPFIRTGVAKSPSEPVRVRYEYRIHNDIRSKQQLALFWWKFQTTFPIAFTQVPSGWTAEPFLRIPSMNGPRRADGTRSGIPPGGTEVVAFEADELPGVVIAYARGDHEFDLVLPEYLTDKQAYELERIQAETDAVKAVVIGPAIPINPYSFAKPLASRVAAHYIETVESAGHPYAVEIAHALAQLDASDEPTVQDGFRKLRDLTLKPVSDPWHQDLSAALRFCVSMLRQSGVSTP
jgi:hypothetical protein